MTEEEGGEETFDILHKHPDDALVLYAALDYNKVEMRERLGKFSLSELIYLRAACRGVIQEIDVQRSMRKAR